MNQSVFIIFIFFLLTSCQPKLKEEAMIQEIEADNKYFKSLRLFGDSSFVFTLRTIDTTNVYNSNKPTAIASLIFYDKKRIDTLLIDSLFARNHHVADPELQIEFRDFNFDGIDDILIAAGSNGRSNHGYHLYLINQKKKKLTYVDGFQEIGNPQPDSANRLITSYVLTGQSFWQFFYIDKNNTLHRVGPYLITDPLANDSVEYEKALREAKKRSKGIFITIGRLTQYCCNRCWRICFQLIIFNQQQVQSEAVVFQMHILTATPKPLGSITRTL